MAFVPVANTVLVEFRMTADLQQVENTIYFEYASAPTSPEMLSLGSALLDWWGAFYAPLVWSGVELREIVLTSLTSASSDQVSFPVPPSTNGGLTLDPLPTNVSLTISFRTALRGRSFRGRNYVVGLIKDQTISANVVDNTTIASWIAAYEELLTVAAAESVEWVVVSRFSGVDGDGKPIPRAAGVTTPINSVVIVDNVVDSQRRRLPGRGR